ncbi:MAG: AAA family ATPase [Nanoarchaeota archaeon]|nr:AAA family ATPase [Nanoarchaeota archaeon]
MWYKFFGWKGNPFSIKSSTELVGLENKKKELLNYILSGDICFLNGPTGVGKTSILRWIEENPKNHKIIYLDAAGIGKGFSLTTYLKKQNSFFNRLFGNDFPKNTVVLIDESQDCDGELLKALKLHWDHDHIKSIVITQISPKLTRFSESFKHRLGKRIVTLDKLSKSEGYDLVKLRVEDKNPFDVSAVEAILEQAEYIPRKILEYCEIVCAKTTGKKIKLNAFDVQNALENNESPKSNQEEQEDTQILIKKLSPMEQNIMSELKKDKKTAKELSKALNTSEGSIGKQLSKLMKKNLVKISKQERPKEYNLMD